MTRSVSRRGSQKRLPDIDTSTAHTARVWNYWLGGKDHYPVDREAGDRVAEMYPDIVQLARAARGFLTRAVLYLAGEAGIRQFLDVGTGLPTVNNTHEVAQSAARLSDNFAVAAMHLSGPGPEATIGDEAKMRQGRPPGALW